MTNTSALIEGHYLTTSYPAASCQCGHQLRWEQHEQEHAAHVIAVIQAQALRDAAAAMQDSTNRDFPGRGWDYQYAEALRRYAARLTATTEGTTDG